MKLIKFKCGVDYCGLELYVEEDFIDQIGECPYCHGLNIEEVETIIMKEV